jgi:hypothetical protein
MPASFLGYDIPAYSDRLLKAIHRYGVPLGCHFRWPDCLDYCAWDYLGYMQPSSGLWWQCYLQEAIKNFGLSEWEDLGTLTILDDRWHFGERDWNFRPGKIEYQVRRALKGLNYVVMIEFEIFRNVPYFGPPSPESVASHTDSGRLIAPHIQGLIWGKRPTRSQRRQFAGGIFGAPGVKIKEVYDFEGALRYMAKPPYRGRSVYKLTSGKLGRRVWSDMSLTLHHLLLCKLHNFSYPELTFAGGEGCAVLADAKRLWRDYRPAAIHPTDHRPPLSAGLTKRIHR